MISVRRIEMDGRTKGRPIKKWKFTVIFLGIVTAFLLAGCAVSCAAAEGGSWSQINQSLARKDGWVRYVQDPSAFRLGESRPLEGSEGVSVCS